MTRALLHPLLLLLVVTLAAGCKRKEKLRQDEDLNAVVAADRRLAEQETQLLTRRGNLQRERSGLQDKRAELRTKKLALDESDTKARQELDQEESKLANAEASLVQQEVNLNKKLQSLLDEKTGLVDKLGGQGAGQNVITARREYSVALRERDVGRREAELAKREKSLAAREESFAERQAKGCGRSVVIAAAPPGGGSGGGSYSRKDVETAFKAALNAMQAKGILTADLPAGTDRLVTEARHSVSSKDYTRGKYAADQLLATVRAMKIDRTFIGAKISRLSAAIRTNPPREKAKVNTLFQQATAAYGDGRFGEANKLLNRIYAQLR
jgi:hypothetical protein